MVKIVKDLKEANEKGLLDIPKAPTQSDLGKIISDVKGIVEGVQALQGMMKPNKPTENKTPSGLDNSGNKIATDMINPAPQTNNQNNKVPVGVLKINDEQLNLFLDGIFTENTLDEKMTIGEIKEKWEILKEMVKPTLKVAINKIAKAEIEFK